MVNAQEFIDRRQHSRHLIGVNCAVYTGGLRFRSQTIDVSLGGVRVKLPSLAYVFLTDPIDGIAISDLPRLDIKVRWRKQGQFGASFVHPQRVRPLIIGLLNRLDAFEVSTDVHGHHSPERGLPGW